MEKYPILSKWIFNPSGKSGKKFVKSFAALLPKEILRMKSIQISASYLCYKAYVRQQKFIINFFLTWKSFANCVHWIFFSFAVFFSSLHKSLRTLWKKIHQIWVTCVLLCKWIVYFSKSENISFPNANPIIKLCTFS